MQSSIVAALNVPRFQLFTDDSIPLPGNVFGVVVLLF